MGNKPASAGNQQGSLRDPSETTRRTPCNAEYRAYLLGALHDGTYNTLHRTFRITQKGRVWLRTLQTLFRTLGYRSWLYREGRERNVYALETTAPFLDCHFDPLALKSASERIAYIRGYFDAEGGTPHSRAARFYIQLCQKNRAELRKVKAMLEALKVQCGKLHNPSRAVDPHYWRFYVRTRSHGDFVRIISSWHPRKRQILRRRMMI